MEGNLHVANLFIEDGEPVIIDRDGNRYDWPDRPNQDNINILEPAIWFTPEWDLGAVKRLPRLGEDGFLQGIVVPIPIQGAYLVKLLLELRTGPVDFWGGDKSKTDPGESNGSYQFYLPEELAYLEPFQGLGYNGPASLFYEMGGHNDFDGSVKWTYREFKKGHTNPRPKLIFTFDGDEWMTSKPASAGVPLKLLAQITYFALR